MTDLGLQSGINALSTPVNWYQFAFLFSAGFSTGGGNMDATPAGNARVRDGLNALLVKAGEHGWGEYRAGPYFQDAVAEQYSFNNHILRRFNERLKNAVDPNGIISPARGGVARLRFESRPRRRSGPPPRVWTFYR